MYLKLRFLANETAILIFLLPRIVRQVFLNVYPKNPKNQSFWKRPPMNVPSIVVETRFIASLPCCHASYHIESFNLHPKKYLYMNIYAIDAVETRFIASLPGFYHATRFLP